MSFDFLNKNNNKAASKNEAAEVKSEEKEVQMVKVVAVRDGWYNLKRIFEGDEFTVPENMVSKIWMKIIE